MRDATAAIGRIEESIRMEVGEEKAIIAVSGGADSSVCAILAQKVVPDRLFPVYIRTGFGLEQEESNLNGLLEQWGLKVKVLDKEKDFFSKLEDITEPWQRRYSFGRLSLECLKEYADSIGARVLINGVNRNDILVSDVVVDSRRRSEDTRYALGLRLVEPLAGILKNDVQKIAAKIGLGSLAAKRHFPGPALAVRISGRITEEKLTLLKEITSFVDVRVKDGYWQFFPFLLSEKLDDSYLIVLRAVISEDGGISAEVKCDAGLLENIAQDILNNFKDVGRVLFDLSPKPPATIEFM